MTKLNWMTKACGLFLLWATAAIALPAQTFTTLHSFGYVDGAAPEAGLIQATDGDLYGTTINGGGPDDGTVFKITPSGTLTMLYTFDDTDGGFPEAGLVQATNGNFYGTTNGGGANGDGTVFKITPRGTLTMLHTFDGTDGYQPRVLVQATNGSFYGTTYEGGANNLGTVFKITPSGTLTTLHSFAGYPTDGAYPDGGLVQAANGDLYGTTGGGGTNIYYGTAFKITPSGTLTTIYNFCPQSGCTDGANPDAGLVLATDGDFYGATYAGGANGFGTVFKITPSGALTTLHSFDETDGDQPVAGLVQATDGNFYGTTSFGGGQGTCFNGGCGTIFQITPSGTLKTLYSFCSKTNCTDGEEPYAGLIQDTNGTFYGTTISGGADDDGTIFSLSVGLGPFVATRPTLGKVGAAVTILGTSLTGSTSVTFNGAAATFTVVSSSEITTTVPTGATSGPVHVVAPGGTLSSNVPFRVLP
jgi:uncharacterized repeat protein (TIGR03803 family)